jgi:hypothetical protein
MAASFIKLPFTGEPLQVAEIHIFDGSSRTYVCKNRRRGESFPRKLFAEDHFQGGGRRIKKSPAEKLFANSSISELHLLGKGSASFCPLVGLANGRYREQLTEFEPNEVGTTNKRSPLSFVF